MIPNKLSALRDLCAFVVINNKTLANLGALGDLAVKKNPSSATQVRINNHVN